MSTVGIGVDIVAISEFVQQFDMPGSVFIRSFSAAELRRARERSAHTGRSPEWHLAARWAGKEAFIKAWSIALLGQAPPLRECDMSEIEVISDAYQRPYIRLCGAVEQAFYAQYPHGATLISLSHDGDIACAYVHILDRGV